MAARKHSATAQPTGGTVCAFERIAKPANAFGRRLGFLPALTDKSALNTLFRSVDHARRMELGRLHLTLEVGCGALASNSTRRHSATMQSTRRSCPLLVSSRAEPRWLRHGRYNLLIAAGREHSYHGPC
jgi:hypothetical protein